MRSWGVHRESTAWAAATGSASVSTLTQLRSSTPSTSSSSNTMPGLSSSLMCLVQGRERRGQREGRGGGRGRGKGGSCATKLEHHEVGTYLSSWTSCMALVKPGVGDTPTDLLRLSELMRLDLPTLG